MEAAQLDLNVAQQEQEEASAGQNDQSTTKKIINLQNIKRRETPLEPLSRIIRLKDIKEKERDFKRESTEFFSSASQKQYKVYCLHYIIFIFI